MIPPFNPKGPNLVLDFVNDEYLVWKPIQPWSHARILYDNILRDATVTASSEAAGFAASNLRYGTTYDRWSPVSVPAYVRFALSQPRKADCIGIAAHNLFSKGATVTLEVGDSDSGPWTEVVSWTPTSDGAQLVYFDDPIEAAHWRLTVDGGVPYIGVVYIGVALQMQRAIYGGHSPIALSRETVISNNRSEGGQFLGRSIISEGRSTSFSWENLTASWYREHFDPFVVAARTTPFFIAWRPDRFPDEVAYGWCSDDIVPKNTGKRDFMSVSFKVEAIR